MSHLTWGETLRAMLEGGALALLIGVICIPLWLWVSPKVALGIGLALALVGVVALTLRDLRRIR